MSSNNEKPSPHPNNNNSDPPLKPIEKNNQAQDGADHKLLIHHFQDERKRVGGEELSEKQIEMVTRNIDPKQAMIVYYTTSTFFSQLMAHPFSRVATILRTQHVLPKAYGASFYTTIPTTFASSSNLGTTIGEEVMASASESVIKNSTGSSFENVLAAREVPFKGAIDAFRKLPKDRTLWRGLTPDVYGRIFGKIFQLQFADEIKNFVQPWVGVQPLVEKDPNDPSKKLLNTKVLATSVISGAVAGVASFLITYPFSVASTRMQSNLIPLHEVKNNMDWQMVNKTNFSNVWQCMKSISRLEGMRGFYSGFSAALPGIAIYRGVYFALFDAMRHLGMSQNYSIIEKFLLSQATIFSAGLFSYPFHVIADRLKVQAGFRKLYTEEETQLFYRGALDAIKKIHQQEGIRGFYRGYLYVLVKSYAGAFAMSMFVALGWSRFTS